MLKRIKKLLLLSIIGGIGILSFSQCSNEYPDSTYDPDISFKPNPTITQMQPDSAFAGIDEITISGSNFSTIPDENFVYFNGEKAIVLSSDESTLVVRAPNFILDSIKVQVSVSGALNFAEFAPYKLIPAIIYYSDFDYFDKPYGLAMDLDENLFVSLNTPSRIVKVGTDQVRNEYYPTKLKTSQMKYGPDGAIYYVNSLRYILRLNADGTEESPYFLALPATAYDLDFDQNQNIFLGGSNGKIIRAKLDKTVDIKYTYTNLKINAVRVFNNYLYVAGTYSGADASEVQVGVWRHAITSTDGDLGEQELVFDFANAFPNYIILSLVIDVDGVVYIGTDAPEGIIVVNLDGTYTPLYEGVMEGEAYAMTWGNSNYLYVTRKVDGDDEVANDKKRILRIDMRKKSAPYFGRY